MTDIEPKEVFRQKAIDLINEYRQQRGLKPIDWLVIDNPEASAFIRSIQLHEKTKQELADFKQEVSKVMTYIKALYPTLPRNFNRFIIPAPKPDPLREIAEAWGLHHTVAKSWVEDLRAALEARGLEIREKGQ